MIYCFVDNTGSLFSNQLGWILPGATGILITTTSNEMNKGGFTARRVSFDTDTINSSLTFTANASLDGSVIMCRGSQLTPVITPVLY